MEALLFAIGIGVLSYVAFVFFFPKAIPDDSKSHTKHILQQLYEETKTSKLQKSGDEASILKARLTDENPLYRLIYGLPGMQAIYDATLQAGYQNKKSFVLFGMVAVFLATFIGLSQQKGMGLYAIVGAPIAGYIIPLRFLRGRIAKRNNRFIAHLPDALDMIVRSVRSGFPLTTALKMVADNMAPPLNLEFKQVVNEIALGRSVVEALSGLAQRINESDIRFFIVVVAVQQETGGNLAEVINNLSSIIRKRKQLRMKIKALTSEGRATGWILGGLPLAVFGVLQLVSPDYMDPLWTDPFGQTLLGAAACMMTMCFFVVRSMINIDI